ncbi:acetolactate synthase, regulatory subunit [Coemansia sp. RSA 2706]|nr:acetolactate synthase, regulatory subunit [Coemansia sp. RSA 2711]KAJ1846075.1 acetolactate synthase, regulatory subunit [Coemansia sp. RSA 2708]KAJ2285938.1 acetolactate synthase, regulatory subunit [Coemansia sp. RSA 2706]KAJ2311245.1 acetolactate synthase, regulatory subunit [Coemansia sp. RSA 2702]KAJ2387800.1 acetolactate synthase, regulatory subunit [Coemansia sp. RSA 2611]KAJ2710754.1 acetolactate synthase, regulatory subunit [Coemansia sp. Cherry 401B]
MLCRHVFAAAQRAVRAGAPRMGARYSTKPGGSWHGGRSTADAVSDIIYKTPTAQKTAHHMHVLNCFMQDEPGILTRATGIMAARGYNIDSVVVSRTEIPGLSRMTITVNGEQAVVQQARKQLEDLPQVWAVVDLSDAKVVEREILLIKLSTLGADTLACAANACTPRQPLSPSTVHRRERRLAAEDAEDAPSDAPYLQVVESSKRLSYIRNLANMFGARVADVGADCCIVELCAKSERVDAFMKIVAPFGILEAARSGRMAMSRAAKLSLFEESPQESAEKAEAPDLSHLPPS